MTEQQKNDVVMTAAQNAWDTPGSLATKRQVAAAGVAEALVFHGVEVTPAELLELEQLAAESV